MKSLYNLVRNTIVAGAITLSTFLPYNSARGEDANDFGGLVERLEQRGQTSQQGKPVLKDEPFLTKEELENQDWTLNLDKLRIVDVKIEENYRLGLERFTKMTGAEVFFESFYAACVLNKELFQRVSNEITWKKGRAVINPSNMKVHTYNQDDIGLHLFSIDRDKEKELEIINELRKGIIVYPSYDFKRIIGQGYLQEKGPWKFYLLDRTKSKNELKEIKLVSQAEVKRIEFAVNNRYFWYNSMDGGVRIRDIDTGGEVSLSGSEFHKFVKKRESIRIGPIMLPSIGEKIGERPIGVFFMVDSFVILSPEKAVGSIMYDSGDGYMPTENAIFKISDK